MARVSMNDTAAQPTRRAALLGGGALAAAVAFGARAQEGTTMRISWWGSDDRHQRTLKLIKLWESRNPGITLKPEYGGFLGYQDKLSTQFAGRNAPDIMQIADNRESLIASGRLLRLDDYVAAGQLDLTNASKSVLETVKVDGKLYGIPWGLACGCFFLDTKVFEDTKTELPGLNWTWDDFAAKARAISRASPKGLYGAADIWTPAGTRAAYAFDFFLRQRGLTLFTLAGKLGFGKDELTEWFTFWDELRKAGGVPPAEVTALESGFETSPLVMHRAAMYPINSSIASSLQGLTPNKLVTMTFPNGIGSKALSGPKFGAFINSSMQVYVNADAKDKKAAVAFLNAITNDPDMAKIQLMSRGVTLSSRMTELVLPDISPVEQTMAKVILYVQEHATPQFVAWPKTGSQIQDLMQRSHQQIAFGQANVAQTASRFFDEAGLIMD